MTELVGTVGFENVTLRELTNLAGVSTRTFYEHFGNGGGRGKDECLLLTHQAIAKQIEARVIAAQSGAPDGREQLRLGFDAFLREIEGNPQGARLALVEVHALGRAALDQTRRTEGNFERLVSKSFSRTLDGAEMPPVLAKGIVAGTAGVARARLLAGREWELPGLVDEVSDWTLSFASPEVAVLAELSRRPESLDLASGDVDEEVESGPEDERALILTAVTKLAAAEGYGEGYGKLTPARVRRAAGVRRRAFDAHFKGVDDCFLAAVELRVAKVLEHIAEQATASGSDGWHVSVSRGIEALCLHIARDPVFAKLALVETYATGFAGMRSREKLIDVTAEQLRAGAPRAQRPSKLEAEASTSAVWSIIRHCVASGQSRQLSQLAPTLSFLALTPSVGAPKAIEGIRACRPSPLSDARNSA